MMIKSQFSTQKKSRINSLKRSRRISTNKKTRKNQGTRYKITTTKVDLKRPLPKAGRKNLVRRKKI